MQKAFLVLLMITIVACNNKATESSEQGSSADTVGNNGMESELPASPAVDKSQYFVWEVDADTKTIRKNPGLQPQYFHVDTIISGLNALYPAVGLQKKRISNDTLYAEIKNAGQLTERMGSLGAEQYVARAVLNLTAVAGIRFVNIDFTEGSHAAPDVWSRESFAAYKEVKE